jgi:hypothetical protein
VTIVHFRLLGHVIRLQCHDPEAERLLSAVFRAFVVPDPGAPADRSYRVERVAPGGGFRLWRDEADLPFAGDTGTLVWAFEQDVAVELQGIRRDLYFLHAAAVARGGRLALLVAESGAGKSTTTWGLLHHGFRFVSDEFAPVDLGDGRVEPFPRALCLKRLPPPAYPLPPGALRTSRTWHVPVDLLPEPPTAERLPVGAVFFVRYDPARRLPALVPLRPAEAGARLYTQALNPLWHPADGLDAALALATSAPCFALETAGLPESCELVVSALS